MEFKSNHGIGQAYEWHGTGPESYDGPGALHIHGPGGNYGQYTGGADSISTSDIVGFLGGDRDPGQFTMIENACYTRRAPYAPTHQSASVDETSATIFFTDNSCDETQFKIYRLIGSTWSLRGTQGGDKYSGYTRTFSENGLSPGTYYAYWVTAVNAYGETYAGAYMTVITLGPPVPPQAVSAAGTSTSTVRIEWSDQSFAGSYLPGAPTAFVVNRYLGGGTWTAISPPLSPGVTSWVDSGLAAGTQYSYWVYAYRGADVDAQRAWAPGYVTANTYATAPNPGTPDYTDAGAGEYWTYVAWDDTSGATIKRQDGGSWVTVGTVPPGQNWSFDYSVSPGRYYAYWIYSNNGEVARTFIAVITAKPSGPRPISAAGQSSSSSSIVWLDWSGSEAGFNIYTYHSGYWALELPTVGPDVSQDLVEGLSPGTEYAHWLASRWSTGGTSDITYAQAYIAAVTFPP